MRPLLALLLTAAPALAQDGAPPAAPPAAAPPAPVAYTVLDARAIPEPLTAAPADPARGAAVWADRCAACHDDAPQSPDPGALRLAVVNLAIARPEAASHAFHDLGEGSDAAALILAAQAVEDVVAWLMRQSDRNPLEPEAPAP